MSALPPSDSLLHKASTSSRVPQRTRNEIEGVNLNRGPALIAMNGCPKTSNDTTSASPDGVS
jgi:hypothetical protein